MATQYDPEDYAGRYNDKVPTDLDDASYKKGRTSLGSAAKVSFSHWKTTNEQADLDSFYNNAQGFIPQFYDVIIYGPYVEAAILIMAAGINGTRYGVHKGKNRSYFESDSGTKYIEYEFEKWKNSHIFKNNDGRLYCSLRWGCSSVKVPMPEFELDQKFCVDSIKSISPPLVRNYKKENTVVLTIAEHRSMLWYQFFTALFNQFFTFPLLKPKNSLRQMAIAIFPKGNYYSKSTESGPDSAISENGTPRPLANRMLHSQVFEYNSAVPESMSPLTWKSRVEGKLEFDINIRVPHPFNEPFKSDLDSVTIYTNPNPDSKIPA